MQCRSFQEIRKKIRDILPHYKEIFPGDPAAQILIKPNLNSNMNALTGNTTDLRLLASVLLFLKEQGYTNITIGEGTNSGFYRSNISVITRLKVDELARYYGVKCIDLNSSDSRPITFENGIQAGVAKECLEADLFINMPKLKTHFEAGMTVCLKNLVGCLVGQENKKKTHLSLAANIVHLNEQCRPHLHIVDALFAMEGLGPTKGTPVKTDTIFIGRDPYLLDLLAARFTSSDLTKIPSLVIAQKRRIISEEQLTLARKYPLDLPPPFAPPKAGPLASFIHHPKRQKYFLAVRNTQFFNWACNTELVGKLLFITDLRQDVFLDSEMECNNLTIAPEKCSQCGTCRAYCPLDLTLPEALSEANNHCIHCLYCFCVCPQKAIQFHGKLGFMEEQMKQYDAIIRALTCSKTPLR
ncbi:MAG: DUF362 domain-containing protein [Candidatus Electrothrix sp. AR3]|nr:DUF362 domain-containing protein [Candidatus Electrothrix sp. AR3]